MIRAGALAALLALAGAAAVAQPPAPLPFAVGGPYALYDQHGQLRTEADPDGRAQLLFFGYANCQEICSAVLPTMGAIADLLEEQGHVVTPVMITVDPARDTLKTLGPALALHHDRFVGLTGPQSALDASYEVFGIETEKLFDDPHYGPVYAHGSFVYLLDGAGTVLTLVPPVLAPEDAAGIIRPYLAPAPS